MISYDQIEYASHTDVGIRRSHNQDAHAVMPAPDEGRFQKVGHVFLVCDGMGGHAVGELAAKLAVDNIPHVYSKYAHDGAIAALQRAFGEANSVIHVRGAQTPEFKGLGTTGICLILRPEGAWIGNVGDSRAYRVRAGVIEQLSFDHSLLWELARKHRKSPEELTGIQSNIISRSLGSVQSVEVDIEGPHPVEPGDVFLLCSDGLSGQVNDRVIGSVMSALPADEAVRFLVHMANLQGGPDNTTVIVVRIVGDPKPAGQDSDADVLFRSGEDSQTQSLGESFAFLSRIPWAFVLLLCGIVMAGVAIVLVLKIEGGSAALLAFILAALTMLAGIVTLMLQSLNETRKTSPSPKVRKLQVYRKTPCPLDAAMVEKLLDATKSLEATIKEREWEFDRGAYQIHAQKANGHFKHKRTAEAFREQCRAMLVLMDAVHSYRGKNEDFNPLWDRPTS